MRKQREALDVEVFMVWVPEPKEISVQVSKISDRMDGDSYVVSELKIIEYSIISVLVFGYQITQLSLTFFFFAK